MKRILWMVLMNLWYVPYGIIRLFPNGGTPGALQIRRALCPDPADRQPGDQRPGAS